MTLLINILVSGIRDTGQYLENYTLKEIEDIKYKI